MILPRRPSSRAAVTMRRLPRIFESSLVSSLFEVKLDGRQCSPIAGKLDEASLKTDECLLNDIFLYDYHQLTRSPVGCELVFKPLPGADTNHGSVFAIGMLERRFSLSRKNSVSLESSDCDGLRDLAFDFATSFSALRTSYASSIADRSTGAFQAARAYRKIIRNQTRSLFTHDGPAPDLRRA